MIEHKCMDCRQFFEESDLVEIWTEVGMRRLCLGCNAERDAPDEAEEALDLASRARDANNP